MGFRQSLSCGTIGEDFVIDFLKTISFSAEKNSDLTNASKHDIICQSGKTSFTGEVKYDVMSEKTGNVAIEVYNPKIDKPSGLYVTESNIWFHLIPDGNNITCWVNSVSKLREYVESTKPKRIIDVGGDNNSRLFLYSFDDILNVGLLRLENLTKPQAKKLIKELLC